MADEVKFEDIKKEEMKFGKRNFIEISRKKATTADGTTEFVSIARGYYLNDIKHYKKNVAIPDTVEMKEFIAKTIAGI